MVAIDKVGSSDYISANSWSSCIWTQQMLSMESIVLLSGVLETEQQPMFIHSFPRERRPELGIRIMSHDSWHRQKNRLSSLSIMASAALSWVATLNNVWRVLFSSLFWWKPGATDPRKQMLWLPRILVFLQMQSCTLCWVNLPALLREAVCHGKTANTCSIMH